MVIIDVDTTDQEPLVVTCLDSDRLTNMRDTVARCDRGGPIIESRCIPERERCGGGSMQVQGACVQGRGIGSKGLTPARARGVAVGDSTAGYSTVARLLRALAPAYGSVWRRRHLLAFTLLLRSVIP